MKSKVPIKKKCEWCGKIYIAYKVTTRFCCKTCNNHAYKDKLRQTRISLCQTELAHQEEVETVGYIKALSYLSPSQTAHYLGVGRSTLYRYHRSAHRHFKDYRPKDGRKPSVKRHQGS